MTNGNHDRSLLRHALATLAYRGGKVLRDVSLEVAQFRAAEGVRTPAEILAHICDLLDWGLSMSDGSRKWNDSKPQAWNEDYKRFFAALQAWEDYMASPAELHASLEKLFQGPVADALAHVGQIAILRRIAGAPIRAENYFAADVVVGRVGSEQTPPKREF